MQTMRRRGVSAARPPAGANTSRQGKASDTQAALKNWRRGRVVIGAFSVIGSSLVLEHLALDDLMYERSEAVIPGGAPRDDGVDRRPVRLRGWAARGVGQQFFGQGSSELVLVLQ